MGQRFRCKYCDFECQGKFALDTMKIHIPMIHKEQPLVYHVQDQSEWTDTWTEVNCEDDGNSVKDNLSAESDNNSVADSTDLSNVNVHGVEIKREPPSEDSNEPPPKKSKSEGFGLSLPVQIKSEPRDVIENEESEFATYAAEQSKGNEDNKDIDLNGASEMYPMLQTILALQAKTIQESSPSPKSNLNSNLPSTPLKASKVDTPSAASSSKAQHPELLTMLAKPIKPQSDKIVKQSPSLVQILSKPASSAIDSTGSGKIVENMLQSTIKSAIQAELSSSKKDSSYPSPGSSAANMLTRMAAQSHNMENNSSPSMADQLSNYPSNFQVVDLKCKTCGKVCANSHTFKRHKRKHPDIYPPGQPFSVQISPMAVSKAMLDNQTVPLFDTKIYDKPTEPVASKPNPAPVDDLAKDAPSKEDNEAAFYVMVRNAIGESPRSSFPATSHSSRPSLPTVKAMLAEKKPVASKPIDTKIYDKPTEPVASKPNPAPVDDLAKDAPSKEDNEAAFYVMVRNAIGESPRSSSPGTSHCSRPSLPTVKAMLAEKRPVASKPNPAPVDDLAKDAPSKEDLAKDASIKEDNEAAFYEMVRNAIGESHSSSSRPSLPTVKAMLAEKKSNTSPYATYKNPPITFEEMVQNAKQGKAYTYHDFYYSSPSRSGVQSSDNNGPVESKVKNDSKEQNEKEEEHLLNGEIKKENTKEMDSKEISTDNAETSVDNKATFEDMVKKVLKDIPSTPENTKESKQNEEISKSNKILSQKLSTEPTVSRNFPLMNSILGSPPVMPANHNREMFDPQPHPLKCQICHKICSNSYTFERHKNVHKKNFIPNVSPDVKIRELHDELPEPWRSIFKDAYEKSMTESRARDCKICGKLCAQDWIYIRHVKMHVRLLATEEESGSPQIVCELCGRQCRSFVGLKRHWDQAKHGPYPPSFKDMERAHYQEKSNQDKNKGRRHKPPKEKVPYNGIRCPICGRACRTYEILRRHWVDYQHGNIDKLEKYIIQQAAEAALKEQLDEGRFEQEQASLKEFAEKFNETTEENGSKRPSRGCKYKASYFDENNIENTDDSEAEVPDNQNAREAEFREYHTEAPNSNFVYLSNPELEQDIKEEQDIDDEYAEYNKAYESFYEDPDTETSYSQGEENYEVRKDENQQAKPEGQQTNAVDLFKTMGETIEKDNSDNPFDFLKNISGLLQNQNGRSEKSSGTLKIKQEKLDDDEQAYVNTGTPQQSNGFGYNSVSLNQFNNDSKNNPSNSEFEAMKNMYGTPRVAESCVDNWNADGDNSINDEEADTQDDTTEDDIDQDTDGVEDNADPKDGDFVPSAESEESDIEN